MKINLIIPSLILLLVSGCAVRVPTSTYKFGSINVKLPKDINAKDIQIEIRSGTNTFVFKAASINSRNNPEVITSSGQVQVDMLKEHYSGADKLTKTAIETAGKIFIPR